MDKHSAIGAFYAQTRSISVKKLLASSVGEYKLSDQDFRTLTLNIIWRRRTYCKRRATVEPSLAAFCQQLEQWWKATEKKGSWKEEREAFICHVSEFKFADIDYV